MQSICLPAAEARFRTFGGLHKQMCTLRNYEKFRAAAASADSVVEGKAVNKHVCLVE